MGDDALTVTESILDHFSDAAQTHTQLQTLRKLLFGKIDLEIRPLVFKNLNLILGAFFANHDTQDDVYELCFDIVTRLKDQIDAEPQGDDAANETEWEELGKSVYLLSDWKDQITFLHGSALQ